MTTGELDAEWLRCHRLVRQADAVIKWDHRISDRVRGIEEELLTREFLVREIKR